MRMLTIINERIIKGLLFLFLLCTPFLRGQENVEFTNDQLTAGAVLEYTTSDLSGFTHVNPMGYVSLIVKEDIPVNQQYALAIRMNVIYAEETGAFTGTTEEITLNIAYNTVAGAGSAVDISKYIAQGAYGVQVEILERTLTINNVVTDQVPNNVALEIGFVSENIENLYIDFPTNVSVSTIHNNRELEINWNALAGAQSYDVEWTWIDGYDGDLPYNGDLRSQATIPLTKRDFELNSSRIQTKNLTYTIPLIYSKGYIVYRVRGVGKDTTPPYHYKFGPWSAGEDTENYLSDWEDSVYQILTDHQVDKNWQFQASYAEDGKKKEVVSYFDGTLRNRQTVTRINSDDNIIVGEVIYDAQGRPAVEVLPVPVNNSTAPTIDFIGEYVSSTESGFNRNATGASYSYKDFDYDAINQLDNFNAADKAMSTSSGASRYYSSQNDVNDPFKSRIPNAEQYPFSQIEYTPDNTGRIRRKSGVGVQHQLGNGHAMEYYYSTPEQKELNRLFGYSVGYTQHYKKNMVIDPNGQRSVSYIDPQGRTIATALIGDTPPNLDPLNDEQNGEHLTLSSDLLGKTSRLDSDSFTDNNQRKSSQKFGSLDDALYYNATKIVPFAETRNFKYIFNTTNFQFECFDGSVAYNLFIDILGPNGESKILDRSTFDPADFNVDLTRGNFSVVKNLAVDADALNAYADQYVLDLQDPSEECYIDPELAIPFPGIEDGCFTTCADCEEALIAQFTDETGSSGAEVYAAIQMDQYDFTELERLLTAEELQVEKNRLSGAYLVQWPQLILACNAPCIDSTDSIGADLSGLSTASIVDNSITCQIGRSALLNDMKPTGQYGNSPSTLNDGDVVTDQTLSLNIFLEVNRITGAETNAGGEYNTWRNPRHPIYDVEDNGSGLYTEGHYYNADGTKSLIRVSEIVEENEEDGSLSTRYDPPIVATANLNEVLIKATDNLSNDEYFIEPQYLASGEDFIKSGIWQDEWAESLLVYHPEYSYLEYAEAVCGMTSNVSGAAVMNPDGYDQYLRNLNSIDAANAAFSGLLTGPGLLGSDPYFQGSLPLPNPLTAGLNSKFTNAFDQRDELMLAMMEDYNGSGNTLQEFSAIIATCGSLSASCPNINVGSMTQVQKEEYWATLKTNYLNLKQTVNTLLGNIYAKTRNSYNGCIGEEYAPVDLLSVIGEYDFSGKSILRTAIDGATDKVCEIEERDEYLVKEKRFQPSDVLYDSGQSAEDAIEEMSRYTGFEYYLETGVCPLARDLQVFLEFGFKDFVTEGITRDGPFTGKYLSRELFFEFGGVFPEIGDNPVELKNSVFGEYLDLNFGFSNTEFADITLFLQGYDWDNYGSSFVISKISNIQSSYNTDFGEFEFSAIAQIPNNSELGYIEKVIRGFTSARISNCTVYPDATSPGQYLGDSQALGPFGGDCNNEPRFEAAYVRLLNYLLKSNQLNGLEVSLNNIPEYADGFLASFFGAGTASWQAILPDNTYILKVNDVNVAVLTLEEDLPTAGVVNYTGLGLNYIFNETGQITEQQARITYQTNTVEQNLIGSLTQEVGDPDSPLINFLCCPGEDINELIGEPISVECNNVDKITICNEFVDRELLLEDYLKQILNTALQDVSPSNGNFTPFNIPLIEEFKSEFALERWTDQITTGNIVVSSVRREYPDLSNADLYYSDYTTSDGQKLELKYSANGLDSLEVTLNMDLDALTTNLGDIREIVCLDIQSRAAGLAKTSLTGKDFDVFDDYYRFSLTYIDNKGNTVQTDDINGVAFLKNDRTFRLYNDCEYFEELNPCSLSFQSPSVSSFSEPYGNLIKAIYNHIKQQFSQGNYNLNNVDISSFSEFQNLINSDFSLKESFEYSTFTYNGNQVIHPFNIVNPNYTLFYNDNDGFLQIFIQLNEYFSIAQNSINSNEFPYFNKNDFEENFVSMEDLGLNIANFKTEFKPLVNFADGNSNSYFSRMYFLYNSSGTPASEYYLEFNRDQYDKLWSCVFFNAQELISNPNLSGKNLSISKSNQTSSSKSITQEPRSACGTGLCIPPVPEPVSCTDAYGVYRIRMEGLMTGALVNLRDEYIIDEVDFCNNYLQYLVEDYNTYLNTFGINSIEDDEYMSIARFGATEFNYGYPGMGSIITQYKDHVDSAAEVTRLSWSAWTSFYLNENDNICVPKAFPVNFSDYTLPLPEKTDCEQFKEAVTLAYQSDTYEAILERKRKEFVNAYLEHALTDPVETFDMEYEDKEYQYTLYYYDQAGNLLQTVPPEGVDRFTENELTDLGYNEAINVHRRDNLATPTYLPDHEMITEYRYNSLNQLVWQETPDGGITRFAYDKLGRIIASQNAKQLNTGRFSYTTYDALGRIVEAGEMVPSVGVTISEATGKLVYTADGTFVQTNDEIVFPKNISNTQHEVTITNYTNSLGGNELDLFETLTNLYEYEDNSRNRVTSIRYYDEYDATDDRISYDNAMYYHYDIHGNVKEFVHHNKLMAINATDVYSGYKRIRYEYDLISGNVNQVIYQDGKEDMFAHRYNYDDDNRITMVETSSDGMIWEKDATYQYFAHGPLARTVIGDKEVQGIDYAYTLQGWLKGVNAENVNTADDMGADGDVVAKDAMGYALGYYENDYQPIGTLGSNTFGVSNNTVESLSTGGGAVSVGENLYNGNIKHMVTALLDNDENLLTTQYNKYGYDQLNRIRGFQTSGASDSYSASYTYDNNGNLQTLNRATPSGAMDQLVYDYIDTDPVTGQTKRTNKLNYVNDLVGDQGLGDLGTQNNGNYQYDEIGQLTRDNAEGLDIDWRVDGKVRTVTKDNGDVIRFVYDGLGNRIAKINEDTDLATLYVRDAQGNVLSVYENTAAGSAGNSSDIETIISYSAIVIQPGDDIPLEALDYIELKTDNESVNTVPATASLRLSAGNSIILKPNFHAVAGSNLLAEIKEFEGEVVEGMFLTENHIYGSSRLGMEQKRLEITEADETRKLFENIVGDKRYELSNHLGNVLSVITDRKLGENGDYSPDVVAYNDYYPFGMLMPGRKGNTPDYRYGFNGMEADNEIKGEGNSYTTYFRQYDPRVARWLTIDPETRVMPWQSPYVSMDNNPILLNDPNGDCPQCLTGALIGLFTEVVAQVGANMFGLNESGVKMSFLEASSFENLDGTDILSATAIGAAEGFFTGGSSKLVRFFAKKRNRKIAGLLLEKSIDVIFEFAENVLKDTLNDQSISAESMKTSFYGALIETGLGSLFSVKILKRYIKNQKSIIQRVQKQIDKAKKRGLAPKKKHLEALEKANKNLNQTQVLEDIVNIPAGAASEIGGNEGGDKVTEMLKGNEEDEKKNDDKNKKE